MFKPSELNKQHFNLFLLLNKQKKKGKDRKIKEKIIEKWARGFSVRPWNSFLNWDKSRVVVPLGTRPTSS